MLRLMSWALIALFFLSALHSILAPDHGKWMLLGFVLAAPAIAGGIAWHARM